MQHLAPALPRTSSPPGWLAAVARVFALHDLLLLGYLATVATLLLLAPDHPHRAESVRATVGTMAALVATCLVARGTPFGAGALGAWAYRTAIAAVVVANYLVLQRLLPVVRTDTVDVALARIDELVFGVQPAVWLEPLLSPRIVETFAFFYFSYFALCLSFVVGILWVARRGRLTTEWAIGTVLVYCVGQLGYMAVPGFGPIVHLAHDFAGPLEGGFFWDCVQRAVASGGAQKDVFPSLHTAAPVFFALHAARRARFDARWGWPAAITAVFAAMIVLSTVILRWHYVVDVVAGLALAFGVAASVPGLARASERARRALGARRAFAEGGRFWSGPQAPTAESRLDPSENSEQALGAWFPAPRGTGRGAILPAGALLRWHPRLGKTSSRAASPTVSDARSTSSRPSSS